MKIKTTIAAALLAVGVISQASADPVIYITGSTAFRANAMTTLGNNSGPSAGGVFDTGTVDDISSYGGSAASKATYALFHGKISGTPTYIDVFWGGSEQGIASVSGSTSQTLNDGAPLAGVPATFLVADTTVNVNGNNTGLPTTGELQTSSLQADLAFADTSQVVSLTPDSGTTKDKDYGIVGIIPFAWVKGLVNSNDAAWGRFTNVNIPQLNVLLTGAKTADFFNSGAPGGVNDFDHTVYLLGRNKGSGTRANYLTSSLYPVTQPIVQFAVSSTVGTSAAGLYGLYYSGGAYNLTTMPVEPGDTLPNDNGYESGSDVSKVLGTNSPAPATGYVGPLGAALGAPGYALTIGFLGVSDALANGNGLGNWVTCNGVPESDGAIEAGTYMPFGHEHLLGKPTPTNPNATALVPLLFNGIKVQFDNNDVTPGSLNNDNKDPGTLHSTGIGGYYMFADKTGQIDTGYPIPGAANGAYTGLGTGTQ